MPQQDKPIERAVPYKMLEDGDTYISIQDGKENWVMKINVRIQRVTKVEGGKTSDGHQLFNFSTSINSIILTPAEYSAMTGRDVQP